MTTLADRARGSLKSIGIKDVDARVYVKAVLDGLTNPDDEMIEAGLAELNLAMGKPAKDQRTYRKLLIVTIYRSMLARASR